MIQIKDNVAPYNINSIGFNKKDGYFWGYKNGGGIVVRIGYDNMIVESGVMKSSPLVN